MFFSLSIWKFNIVMEGQNCTIQQFYKIYRKRWFCKSTYFSHFFFGQSLFGFYCGPVSVITLIQIRILSNGLNESLMQELFIELWTELRDKQGVLRHLETCSSTKLLAPVALKGWGMEVICWNLLRAGAVEKGLLQQELYLQRVVATVRNVVPEQGMDKECVPWAPLLLPLGLLLVFATRWAAKVMSSTGASLLGHRE